MYELILRGWNKKFIWVLIRFLQWFKCLTSICNKVKGMRGKSNIAIEQKKDYPKYLKI